MFGVSWTGQKLYMGDPPDRCGRGWAYVSKGTYKKEKRGDVCVATTKVKNKGGVLYTWA